MKSSIVKSFALLLFSLAAPAFAAVLTVSNTNDSGPGSLRDSVDSSSPGDRIDIPVTGTISLSSGEIGIMHDITITGSGSDSLVVSGTSSSRVFNIWGGRVSIRNLTISDGYVSGSGGGIYNVGDLSLTDAVISNNTANENAGIGGGGGIYNEGRLTLLRTKVTGNQVTAYTQSNGGAGIFQWGSDTSMTLVLSEVSGNTVFGEYACGGGLYNGFGTVRILGSTIEDNEATTYAYGGGIYSEGGSLFVDSATIASNSVAWDGGGIYASGGNFTMKNSTLSGNHVLEGNGAGLHLSAFFSGSTKNINIFHSSFVSNSVTSGHGGGIYQQGSGEVKFWGNLVADNNAQTAPDCSGTVPSLGYNLIGNATGCDFTAIATDQVGTDSAPINPLIGLLEDNGGPTETHALQSGSPALDAIPSCRLQHDQRRTPRPQGSGCDIGSFEYVNTAL